MVSYNPDKKIKTGQWRSVILIGIMIKGKTIAQFRVPYVELF